MKILVYGAGVLGSLYAARLKEFGNDVSILARGERYRQIAENGIVLEHALHGNRTTTWVDVVEQFGIDDEYDLALVIMKKNQVSSILPALSDNKKTSTILFMVNDPSGYGEWVNAVGKNRIMIGFPGAGGTRSERIVRYHIVSRFLQPTTFGEIDGRVTPRLTQVRKVFRDAGFPTAICRNIDAWQKYHVAWVVPITCALYMAGGDGHKLACNSDAVRLMVKAVREGFSVLKTLNHPITPIKLKMWELVPMAILVLSLRWWADTEHFETVATHHSLAALDEMKMLADEFMRLIRATDVQTPSILQLYIHLRPLESCQKAI